MIKDMKTASWVIVRKDTGEAIFETFNEKLVSKINHQKFKAVPILDYLQELNRKTKQQRA